MTQSNTGSHRKPYVARERLFAFAVNCLHVSRRLQRLGPVEAALSVQLAQASSSSAANFEEADDASSPRDFRAKARISLREIKESSLRLRQFDAAGLLIESERRLLTEATELRRILAAIVRNAER